MEKEILNQERLHLENVKKKIEAELCEEQQVLAEQQSALTMRRREMWQECAHGVNDFDDIVNMNAYDEGLREEYGHFVRREQSVKQLSYLRKSPYFGRIDFVEEGDSEVESIYIGRYGFRNKKTREYEVFDWRTPIASMFYDCSIGEASYECPAGRIFGELTCKRQFKIEEGVLKYCYDTNLAVQDELLGEVLAENTDKVLRVIIDTITREQNEAIRESKDLDLLVVGPAGSGKTSVGMHRLAYLLYHNREYLTSEKIVVLSRNQIFSSYVAGILPELGEENVNDITFDSLVWRGIPREYRKFGYYNQVEYLLEHDENSARNRGIVLKYSKEFLQFLKEKAKLYREKKTDFFAAQEIYLATLKKFILEEDADIYHDTKRNLRRGRLYYEDLLVIGYIRILLGAIRPMHDISHVVVDEAQDYNRLQLLIIKELFPKGKFTILADKNQAIHECISTTDMTVFFDIFGKKMKQITLSKSYRSTAPINRFAFSCIGIENVELYVDRVGKEPEFLRTSNMKQTVEELLNTIPREKSTVILTCDTASAKRVRERIGKNVPESEREIQYILNPDETLEKKIVVMPIMLAKGLEFDVVIVWDDRTAEYWDEKCNLKYLMCTRALHELYFVSSEVCEEI